MKIVCDYCGKFKLGMVSCEKCNLDVCRSCVGDKTINTTQNSFFELKTSKWRCTEVSRKKEKFSVDLVLDFKNNGEISGTGVNNQEGTFKLRGYYYFT